MAITYFEISYPNFVLGAIIDPEEANQNNHEIVTKINDIIEANNINEVNITNLGTVKADKVYVDERDANLAGAGRTTETIKANFDTMVAHKIGDDHDSRYYTKSETFTNVEINNALNLKANKSDTYTRAELAPWLRGGDTQIKEEVFTIINPNNGDGTFTYMHNGEIVIGYLTEEGQQIFELTDGFYEVGTNRLEVFVGDTLRRSVASGGIIELSPTSFILTSPEGSSAEITAKYYERIGMTAEYNIKMSATKPPFNYGKNMWFKVIE